MCVCVSMCSYIYVFIYVCVRASVYVVLWSICDCCNHVETYKRGITQVQHRMRPEISSLIKKTYPELKDGPKTHGRPPLRGASSSLIFIDHDEPESAAQTLDQSYKANLHEVGMVTAIVRYLVQQGYKTTQLVVLTPYLGQLQELRRALSADWRVLVDQLDLEMLDSAGIADDAAKGASTQTSSSSSSSSKSKPKNKGGVQCNKNKSKGSTTAKAGNNRTKGDSEAEETADETREQGVRVATIDNFQGEEADVVIVSLVRCNATNTIGFLSQPGRVNVLLSRARDAQIMIGSKQTLCNASNRSGAELWQNMFENKNLHVCSGFPAVCKCHGTSSPEPLSTPQAFKRHVPDGGCGLKCIHTLPCGHECPLRCHPHNPDHSSITCTEVVTEYCDQGHVMTFRCSLAKKPACATCTKLANIRREAERKLKNLQRESEREKTEAEERRVKLEGEAKLLLEKISKMEVTCLC